MEISRREILLSSRVDWNMNEKTKTNSQRLRREMTQEERLLWYDFLKKLPNNVYRQKPVGSYIADFYIANPRIVIELDGSQHRREDGMKYDQKRDEYMQGLGIKVLRYRNVDVSQKFSTVCRDILYHLGMDDTDL